MDWQCLRHRFDPYWHNHAKTTTVRGNPKSWKSFQGPQIPKSDTVDSYIILGLIHIDTETPGHNYHKGKHNCMEEQSNVASDSNMKVFENLLLVLLWFNRVWSVLTQQNYSITINAIQCNREWAAIKTTKNAYNGRGGFNSLLVIKCLWITSWTDRIINH